MEIGDDAEVYRKVWNIQCKRQEITDSQIGADDEDKNQRTIIELVFYMIYIDQSNAKPMETSCRKEMKKNSERYPLKEVSADMY